MTSIKRNFLYNTFYQVLTILIPLITTPYLTRTLGAAGIGEYSYAYSIAYYFVMLMQLGLNNYGNREIAKIAMIAKKDHSLFLEFIECN